MAFFGFFGRNKQAEPVKYIDEELLRKIKEIKDYVERNPKCFKDMRKALMKCKVMFSEGISKGRIEDKDKINAAIQLTDGCINSAELKVNTARSALKLNPDIVQKRK
jgi:hypothetical protein